VEGRTSFAGALLLATLTVAALLAEPQFDVRRTKISGFRSVS
jgi:hypothetical protein